MGLFDFFGEQYTEFNNIPEEHHKARLSHELIAGAASYEAVKAYNEHCAKNGKPNDHATAMEILAGFAGSAIDRMVETKGLDFIDRERAKRHAEEQVKQFYEFEA
ncbi:uncharacterized protein BX663DRAFT_503444 [Cokeromyces recurvatus]|uniref:uncharacterized protein n=1 Tax=Cokeromyces recurvatus TaxID=90255 RepID=UPI00221F7790|nr:uncharacterized protein BX663DRAFT_503444 [Cokeromyces recurvatus]KAI7904754.1 hypothetical protein BX663DRAFT_503444 [Cokeromyces recurvatus]